MVSVASVAVVDSDRETAFDVHADGTRRDCVSVVSVDSAWSRIGPDGIETPVFTRGTLGTLIGPYGLVWASTSWSI